MMRKINAPSVYRNKLTQKQFNNVVHLPSCTRMIANYECVSRYVDRREKYNCKNDYGARFLCLSKDADRFHAFHNDKRTSENASTQSKSFLFFFLFIPLSITAQSPDNFYQRTFDKKTTRESARPRRIDTAPRRQVPGRKKSRSGRSTPRYPWNPLYSNKSHGPAI